MTYRARTEPTLDMNMRDAYALLDWIDARPFATRTEIFAGWRIHGVRATPRLRVLEPVVQAILRDEPKFVGRGLVNYRSPVPIEGLGSTVRDFWVITKDLRAAEAYLDRAMKDRTTRSLTMGNKVFVPLMAQSGDPDLERKAAIVMDDAWRAQVVRDSYFIGGDANGQRGEQFSPEEIVGTRALWMASA